MNGLDERRPTATRSSARSATRPGASGTWPTPSASGMTSRGVRETEVDPWFLAQIEEIGHREALVKAATWKLRDRPSCA